MSAARQLEQLRAALAGRYAVERALGRGGMATVYAAEDVRHHRRVAIKFLDPELGAALGAERFLREIAVTAGLHHPRILPLHDSGEVPAGHPDPERREGEGPRLLYYVMPLVEGESLRQRLARERQLPVDEAVRITCDVASALDHAHRRGVVHRDLKPENILLQDGEALVADFGIARAIARAADADTLTGTGVTVGTPQYMSPEQAAGERELDARSDVYSLGCVLYEMLAGSPPFTAPTAQGVVAKVLTEPPRPLVAERRAVPPRVEAAVHRALEKLPADRFATAGTSVNGRRALRLTRRDAGWAAIVAALSVAAFVTARRSPDCGGVALTGPARFTLAIADSQRLAASPRLVAISPDSRVVVYTGEAGPGRRMLYLRPLDQLSARPIPGTESAVGPFFSPDGRWIAFTDDTRGQLKKVPVGGGRVVPIGDHSSGDTWGANDVIVGSSPDGGLAFFSADGSTATRLTVVDTARGERAHSAPVFLPDGKTVAFRISLSDEGEGNRIGLVSVDARPSPGARTPRHISLDVPSGTPIGYAGGMLIVGRPDGTVVAVPLDLRRGIVRGEPMTVLDQVVWNRGAATALAADGSLVYVRGTGGSRITLVDERGTVIGGFGKSGRYLGPRWASDGRRIALELVSAEAAGSDIWVYDVPSGVLSRLTSRGSATRPEWTPDGKRVAYIRRGDEGRPSEVWWMPADKSGPEERLYALPSGPRSVGDMAFSPAGHLAVLRTGEGPPRTNDLWLLSLDSVRTPAERRATPLLQTPFSEAMPRVSLDGRWLAYVSNETGQSEVYVCPFPGPGGSVQVSTGGGAEPVWMPDGRQLVYRTGDQFIAATLASTPATAGAPSVSVTHRRVLFEGRYVSTLSSYAPAQYDVSPDGKRFVVLRPTSEDREVIVVLNWVAELRARMAEAHART